MAYLIELRRDADTYHMVWCEEADPLEVGNQFEFRKDRAFAIAVDDSMAAMGEDDRLRELFKRARQHVQDQQAQEVRQSDPTTDSAPKGGKGKKQGTAGPGAGPS